MKSVLLISIIQLLQWRFSYASESVSKNEWCTALATEEIKEYPECEEFNVIVDPDVDPIVRVPIRRDQVLTSNLLFEGDIRGIEKNIDPNDLKKASNYIKDDKKHWPDGVIPFVISASFRPYDSKIIRAAMDAFQQKTCVKFRPKTDDDVDYIRFAPAYGCNSFVGKLGNRQDVTLQIPACMESGIIQHELMHAIGFYHEQSRSDRDEYVDINWSNIREANRPNFQKYTDAEVTAFNEPYDFNSLMHYGMLDFAIDRGQYTIKPKPGKGLGATLGQRNSLSQIDINKIKLAYCKPLASAMCPTTPGWGLHGNKCYFFSFFAAEQRRTFAQARNYCRRAGSLLLSPYKDEVLSFLTHQIRPDPNNPTSDPHLDPAENIWVAGCQTINGYTVHSSDLKDELDCGESLHFFCEKPVLV